MKNLFKCAIVQRFLTQLFILLQNFFNVNTMTTISYKCSHFLSHTVSSHIKKQSATFSLINLPTECTDTKEVKNIVTLHHTEYNIDWFSSLFTSFFDTHFPCRLFIQFFAPTSATLTTQQYTPDFPFLIRSSIFINTTFLLVTEK